MPKHPVFKYDDIDSRREIFRLIGHLTPVERISWMRWCCSRSSLGDSDVRPMVSESTLLLAMEAETSRDASVRLQIDLHQDLLIHLPQQWGLDIDAAVVELVRRARLVRS